MTQRIIFKSQSVRLFGEGSFGNRTRQWNTLEELDADGFRYPIVIRYRHIIGGNGPIVYHMTRHQVPFALVQLEEAGWDMDRVYFNEGTPDHKAILQGELCQMEDGSYHFFYNTVPMHMNDALHHEGAREIHGRHNVLSFIKQYMTESSYEDLLALLDTFENHVVEFTAFSCLVGDLKGRNVIYWDCRFH